MAFIYIGQISHRDQQKVLLDNGFMRGKIQAS